MTTEKDNLAELTKIAETKGRKNRENLVAKLTAAEKKEYRKIREKKRGIKRDSGGEIVLTRVQKEERIRKQEARIIDYSNRTKNARADIERLKAELAEEE